MLTVAPQLQEITIFYRQAVIKETLRLHPAVAAPLERVVPPEGATVGGHYLQAGTIVGMNPWVIHRDTTIYGADAEEFRPERWLDSPEEQLKLMGRYSMAVRGLHQSLPSSPPVTFFSRFAGLLALFYSSDKVRVLVLVSLTSR
jgi:cytochrome P450